MSNLILFEEKHVRRAWDKVSEKWWFAIVDVISILTGSPNPQVYWRVMKKRLRDEGNQTVTNCNALKMTAADGRQRLTDVAQPKQILRIAHAPLRRVGLQRGRSLSTAEAVRSPLTSGSPAHPSTGTAPPRSADIGVDFSVYGMACQIYSFSCIWFEKTALSSSAISSTFRFSARTGSRDGEPICQSRAYSVRRKGVWN